MKTPLVIALTLAAMSASAQVPEATARPAAATGADAAVERARRLINEGRGAEGRAVLDSLLRVLPPGSPQIGSVLLGRAMTATTSEQAEADLRRVTVEFALTPPAETALVRLAQLEMQRGDRAAAFSHLQRLMVEYTTPGARARAAYWMGRLHRDGGDEAKACEAFGSARTWTPPADVELANQVEYAARRCPAMPAAVASAPVQSAPPPVTTPAPVPATVPATVMVDKPTFSPPPPAPARPDTSPTPARDTSVRAALPTSAAPSGAAAPTVTAASTASSATPAARHFSVQIAAYSTMPDAERLAESYRKGGADARVDGTAAPFRVRVGRYATREEANKVAEDFRRRGQAAFVVVVEPR